MKQHMNSEFKRWVCVWASVCTNVNGTKKNTAHVEWATLLAIVVATATSAAMRGWCQFFFAFTVPFVVAVAASFRPSEWENLTSALFTLDLVFIFPWKSNKDLRVWDKKATNRNIRTHTNKTISFLFLSHSVWLCAQREFEISKNENK